MIFLPFLNFQVNFEGLAGQIFSICKKCTKPYISDYLYSKGEVSSWSRKWCHNALNLKLLSLKPTRPPRDCLQGVSGQCSDNFDNWYGKGNSASRYPANFKIVGGRGKAWEPLGQVGCLAKGNSLIQLCKMVKLNANDIMYREMCFSQITFLFLDLWS